MSFSSFAWCKNIVFDCNRGTQTNGFLFENKILTKCVEMWKGTYQESGEITWRENERNVLHRKKHSLDAFEIWLLAFNARQPLPCLKVYEECVLHCVQFIFRLFPGLRLVQLQAADMFLCRFVPGDGTQFIFSNVLIL